MNKQDTRRKTRAALPWLAAALLTAGALGADRFWNDSFGGAFGDEQNWDDGAQGIPGLEDAAIFDLPALFDVTFDQDYSTDRVLVRAGRVTFTAEKSFEYRLLNPFPTSPSITVGVGDGDTADLTLQGGTLWGDFVDVGDEAAAFGGMTVSGASSVLIADAQINVGNEGVGVLDVTGGGIVASVSANVGQLGGSLGQVTVTDPDSTWLNEGSLTIARFGVADLVVERGATVSSGDATVGQEASAQGSVVLRDAGSEWTIDGTLDVGMNGFGSLVVENGARLTNHTFATVGTFPGDPERPPKTWGIGEAIVSGDGSSWEIDGDLLVPFLAEGTLTVGAGGAVAVAGDLALSLGGGFLSDPLNFVLTASDDYPTAAIDVVGVVCEDSEMPFANVELEYEPELGDTFVLLTASAGVGVISLELPPLPVGLDWRVTQTDTLLEIAVAESCAADFDGSGDVGFPDLVQLLAAWGDEGGPEDLNGNGFVDFPDIVLLLAAWGPCS